MAHSTRIAEAIEDLESQMRPNFSDTARRYNVERTTLRRRFRGEQGTIQQAISETRQRLTHTQEEVVIEQINKLSGKGLSTTPQMVKNFAQEIAGVELGPNWVSRFIRRHQDRLTSRYLRAINHSRKIADNSENFQHFFDTVRKSQARFSWRKRPKYPTNWLASAET